MRFRLEALESRAGHGRTAGHEFWGELERLKGRNLSVSSSSAADRRGSNASSRSPAIGGASAAPTELFFSEYIEGSSNNKALEIYNGTGAPIDLAVGGYSVAMYFNGATTAGLTIFLTGTVAAGDVYVVAQATANAAILAQADQTNGAGWFNGDDAVVLRKGGADVDVIGQIGFDPGTEWGTGLTSTMDNTLRRKAAIEAGDPTGGDAFDPSVQWDGFANDTFDGLGSHGTPPARRCAERLGDLAHRGRHRGRAEHKRPDHLQRAGRPRRGRRHGRPAPRAVRMRPPSAAARRRSPSIRRSTSATARPARSPSPRSGVSDQDLNDPPNLMAADHVFSFQTSQGFVCGDPATRIHQIQGSGAAAALTGVRTIEGVVVGDYQGAGQFNGYYVQEEIARPGRRRAHLRGHLRLQRQLAGVDNVSAGDVVRVRGTAGEFERADAAHTAHEHLGAPVCASGASVPATPVCAARSRTSPTTSVTKGCSSSTSQTLTATEVFNLGRFGEVSLSGVGRLYNTTAVALPGAPAEAVAAQNARSRIVLDDASNTQNNDPTRYPTGGLSATNTLRVGDTLDGLTGVLDFRFGAYRIQPVGAVELHRHEPADAPRRRTWAAT